MNLPSNPLAMYLVYCVFLFVLVQMIWSIVEYIMTRRVEVYLIQRAGDHIPSPAEVSALIEEARTITREARDDRLG